MRRSQSGQTMVEYILLMVLVVGMVGIVLSMVPGQLNTLSTMMRTQYAASYRYGDKAARGSAEGGFERHPRADAEGSFRMFRRDTN